MSRDLQREFSKGVLKENSPIEFYTPPTKPSISFR